MNIVNLEIREIKTKSMKKIINYYFNNSSHINNTNSNKCHEIKIYHAQDIKEILNNQIFTLHKE